MRASQDDCVDEPVRRKKTFNMLFDEIIRAFPVEFVAFDQRHPHRASLLHRSDIGKIFFYFYYIRLGCNRSGGSQDADMPRFCQLAHQFGDRPDNAQNASLGRDPRQILLLDCAKSFCGCSVAGNDGQVAALFKQPLNGFQRIGVNGFEGPAP